MSTTTDGRSARWAEHREARRRQLVESTIRTIRERGAAVGMDEFAAAAGTSKTVFYRHFTDRAGLYRAVAAHVDDLILRDIRRVLGDHTAQAKDRLSALDADPRSVIIDTISLPEPASAALLGLGALALCRRRQA